MVRELSALGDAVLGYFVDQARHAGHTWSEIGDALGVSKQAAQQRQTVRMALGVHSPTFERFTPRARSVLEEAEPIARAWGHGYVGTEHLLLALYRQPQGVAAQVLVESKLSADEAEAAISRHIEPGAGAPEGKLAFTASANAVMTGALASAVDLGHGYIGTEHLLLGLARTDGVGAEVLAECGLSQEALAVRVVDKLERYAVGAGAAGAAGKRPAAEPTTTRKAPGAKSASPRSSPRRSGS